MPPLLDRIARNSTTVVCPDIDTISDATFEYMIELTTVGGFSWDLQVCRTMVTMATHHSKFMQLLADV
jgi:hypothetical protein